MHFLSAIIYLNQNLANTSYLTMFCPPINVHMITLLMLHTLYEPATSLDHLNFLQLK